VGHPVLQSSGNVRRVTGSHWEAPTVHEVAARGVCH
jgi:hypothetical protein